MTMNVSLALAAIQFALAFSPGSVVADTPPVLPPPAETEPATASAEAFRLVEAVVYHRVGERALRLDLAAPPATDELRPAVVCLFGGGWISGSRKAMRDRIEFLAAHGFVAVAPDYRLAPADPFPAAVADVRQCVRWLRRHAAEYGVDPNRIAALGYSAGGHLACMLGVASDDDNFGPDDAAADGTSARVQAVVNFFGPADMAAADWSALAERKYLVPFLGGTPEDQPEAYRQASPITYITPDDPPTLTLQGDEDRTVPMSIAVDLHKRLAAAGVVNELVIVEGQGHGWPEPHRSRIRSVVVDFLNAHLRSPVARNGAAE